MTSIVFKVEVADFVEELETLSKRLNHLLAGFALLDRGVVLAQDLLQVNTVVIQGRNKLSLCHVLSFIYQEGHDCFGNHIVHALTYRVEVGDDQALDNMSLHLGAR